MEVVRFTPEEIDEAIEGMDGLQEIIVPLLRKINLEGMAEKDIQELKKHIMMAKHALITMGEYMEGCLSNTANLTELEGGEK